MTSTSHREDAAAPSGLPDLQPPDPNAGATAGWALLFDAVAAPLLIVGMVSPKVLWANASACDLLGYPQPQIIEQDWATLLGALDLPCPRRAGEAASQADTWGLHRDGRKLWLHCHCQPLHYHDTAAWLITARDDTCLRRSQEKVRNVIDAMSDAVFLYEAQTLRLIESNRTATELYACNHEIPCDKGFVELSDGEPPFSKDNAIEHLQRARTHGPQLFEWQAKTCAGQPFWAEVAVRCADLGEGDTIIVTVRDLSTRKQGEADRLALERRLFEAQRQESIGMLAGGIAHDFNNLLTTVLGNLELAQCEGPNSDVSRMALREATEATLRAAELTRLMLAYAGKGRVQVRRLDLAQLIDEHRHVLRAMVPRTIELHLDMPRHLPAVQVDATQIQQIIVNLLTNALEAIGEHTGRITLRLGWGSHGEDALSAHDRSGSPPPAGDFVFVEVHDTGHGMDHETQQRLFEPFFSTRFTGRGLSMAAVQGIVRSHGGAIFVRSAPNKGTSIRILLPVAPEATPGTVDVPTQRNRRRGAPLQGQVLIIEDEDGVRDLMRRMCERMGLTVWTASSGRQGLVLFEQHLSRIDCVILDLTMPDLDGCATLARLQIIDPQVRVIMASGLDEESVQRQLKGRQVSAFIAKPYTYDTLYHTLAHILTTRL